MLDEQVALKVILPHRFGDPHALERFRAEVKIARRITHPNVCRVFDLGEDGDISFLTMELVEGSTLRQELVAGPLELSRALESRSKTSWRNTWLRPGSSPCPVHHRRRHVIHVVYEHSCGL